MFTSSELVATRPTGNVYLDSITYSRAWIPGITINYVLQGDGAYGGTTWGNGAREGFAGAVASWSAVANIIFVEEAGPYRGAGSTSAYDFIEGFKSFDDGTLGEHTLPFAGTLRGDYNNAAELTTRGAFTAGGYTFATFVHEVGHGIGLVHPHPDPGDPPDRQVFPGVVNSGDLGENWLNQGIFTTMSYNSGYAEVGIPNTYDFGWNIGPGAFDIATVQAIYGANTETNKGATTYALPTVNAIGTGWNTIWDTGGIDTISAANANGFGATIDLRAATLVNEIGGGGFASWVGGVLGGVTIANGVVIENALGGSGDDILHGNAASNRLDGGAGYDLVSYAGVTAPLVIDLSTGIATGDGTDTLVSIEGAIGGSGNDRLIARNGFVDADALNEVFVPDLTNRPEIDLDGRFASSTGDPAIGSASGTVSVRLHSTGEVQEYYGFTAPASGPVLIDIDNTFAYDSVVRVFDAERNLVASNDDVGALDAGSATLTDSYLELTSLVPGARYSIEVSEYARQDREDARYDLVVTMQTTDMVATSTRIGSYLEGGDGDDVLVGGSGNDVLSGGSGEDTVVYARGLSNYTIAAGASGEIVVTGDGVDQLYGVERIQFGEQLYRLFPSGTLSRIYSEEEETGGFYGFRIFSTNGFAGSFGGETRVFGTSGFQDFTVLPGTLVTFDPSFNRGGDIIRLPGDADDYTINTFGSNVRMDGPSMQITIPVGLAGTHLVFDDGARLLYYDVAATSVLIGSQEVEEGKTARITSPADTGPLPVGAVDTSVARAVAIASAEGTLGGDYKIFGSASDAETVVRLFGDFSFDPSFNRGGDTIVVGGAAADFAAYRNGSQLVLLAENGQLNIPVGPQATHLVFDGEDERDLRIDTASGTIMVGDVSVTATSLATAVPLDPADQAPMTAMFVDTLSWG